MDGLKASGDSFCICNREVSFDDVTIFNHYSPALTLARMAYHLLLDGLLLVDTIISVGKYPLLPPEAID